MGTKPRDRTTRGALAAAALLLLAACQGPPQPHRGNPGGAAAQLAVPLAVRLAVAPPGDALLPGADARSLAAALAEALQAQDIPATATDAPLPLDWRLLVSAAVQGGSVLPRFRILDADGQEQGAVDGVPVATRLWAAPTPELLGASAEAAAQRIARLLVTVRGARAAFIPGAGVPGAAAGPARLRLVPVRGAPGDGNQALTARLGEALTSRGFLVQTDAERAAFAVTAEVAVARAGPRTERVEIQWIVLRRDGQELGRVVQLNELPAGALSRAWGDIAYVAAQEAAAGVQQVIETGAVR